MYTPSTLSTLRCTVQYEIGRHEVNITHTHRGNSVTTSFGQRSAQWTYKYVLRAPMCVYACVCVRARVCVTWWMTSEVSNVLKMGEISCLFGYAKAKIMKWTDCSTRVGDQMNTESLKSDKFVYILSDASSQMHRCEMPNENKNEFHWRSLLYIEPYCRWDEKYTFCPTK